MLNYYKNKNLWLSKINIFSLIDLKNFYIYHMFLFTLNLSFIFLFLLRYIATFIVYFISLRLTNFLIEGK